MRPAVAAAACSAVCTVVAVGLATVAPVAAAATPTGPTRASGDADSATALARLRADADKPLRLHGDRSGRVTFVGTRTGDVIDNPSVSPDDDAVTVARHDLARYGDALGLTDGDRGMRTLSRKRALTGDTVVRLQQTVDGLPVLGGQVVVSVDGNGGTSSILSTTSSATRASAARVARADAAATALAVTAHAQHRPASSLRATDGSLAVFDPAAFGAYGVDGARTVRQFEVTNGTDVREQVLVDAVTGRVLLHVDDVQTALNRKVCDQKNVRKAQTNCSSSPTRREGGAASSVADVNKAYDLSGKVSTFYHDIGLGTDLTNLIGFGAAGSKTLGSTVRFCEQDSGTSCPYDNAFWNGSQMFYGAGFAGADDVVGHEMTHGVISKYSDLFYFFQSGAINESLADTMGEIFDHRFGPDAGNNTWTIGEDLPIGAIRSLADPTIDGQPDKMTSPSYDADVNLTDSGGVHTNSGVGNKTAYLIMHGGTFNGVTVTGIDAGDPHLTKTAKLYLDVIEKLASGSDYSDLGRQLMQSCSDFVTAGKAGFTSDDCTNVGLAVQATELATQPTVDNASTPTDAPVGCPSGQFKHVLFNDETSSNPATEFAAGSLWTRAPGSVNGFPANRNATSGKSSWFGLDPDPSLGDARNSSLTLAKPVTVPKAGNTYMRFNHWYAFDYDPSGSPRVYYDGGLVKVDNTGDSAGAQQTSGLPWVNGPTRAVRGSGTTSQTGFGGVSNGFTASRVDLSSYAGKTIEPQFQVVGDDSVMIEGWYLDDIEIYTCDQLPNKPTGVSVSGGLGSAKVSWTAPDGGHDISGYRVTGTGGLNRDLSSTARSTTFSGLQPSTSYTFVVRALNQDSAGATTSLIVTGTRFSGLAVARTGKTETEVTGRLLNVSSAGLGGKTVQVQRKASDGTWSTIARPRTDSSGRLSATLNGRSTAGYRLLFAGGNGLMGGTSGTKHL